MFYITGKERAFRTLGPLQGMSQASAISIWQDKWGRMWIGNEVLNCYDGDHVSVYRLSEYFSDIEDADIHGICGNDSALYLLAGDNLIQFNLITNQLNLLKIKAHTLSCHKNTIYYSYNNELYTYNAQTNQSVRIFEHPYSISIISILLTDNTIWLGTTAGLFKLERAANNTDFRIKQFLRNEGINCLYQDSRKNIWAGCRSQQVFIISQEEQVETLYDSDGKRFRGEVFSITESVTSGNIWMGTRAGIYLIAAQHLKTEAAPLLPTSMIYALYTDRQGGIWIGSYYGVVRYFNPQTDNYRFWKTDEEQEGKIHGVVLGEMAEDKAGNLYVATEGSGINVIDPKTGNVQKHIKSSSDGLPNDKIRALWYDEEYNRLYISSYMDGLCLLDIKTGKVQTIQSELLNSRLKKIIEKIIPYQDHLLLLTQDGIFQLDRKTQEITYLFTEPELNELCSGFIRTIHVDDRHTLWVSSFQKGFFTINLSTKQLIRSYTIGREEGQAIPSAIVSICGNMKQGLFLATSKSGILKYEADNDTFLVFSAKDNWLLNDVCYTIALTSNGNLVTTSNQGVTLLNISARKTIDSSWHIRLNDSYPLSEISEDCGLYVSPRTGDIYVGGLYGMFGFNEKEMHLPNNNYALYLSSLLVNNQPYTTENIADLTEITLPYNKNTINLTFTSSNYMPSYHTRYQYKMEGLDTYWNDTEYKTITYSSLRPGNYHLVIQETTNPEKQIELDIIIRSPFWLSWPAFLIYACIIILCLRFFGLFYKSKAKLQASLEMERRENDRMEEINRNQIDFFTNISNEFRTPLTLIISLSYHLLQDISGTKKSKMIQIRKQAFFLQSLISDFLDLQKIGWNKLPLTINSHSYPDFVQEMCSAFSTFAPEKTFNYPKLYDEPLIIWFDRTQLQKVFYNLLSIAFKLITTNGKVKVSYQKRSGWIETLISCYVNSPDKKLVAVISETLNRPDDESTDIRMLPGNSIGLALSKRIIELLKGELFAITEDDVISFCIRLRIGEKHFGDEEKNGISESAEPLLLQPNERLDEPGPAENTMIEPSTKKHHLLLIDNDDEMTKLLTTVFSPVYEITTVSNDADGYEQCVKEQPDIIISETFISGGSGIELCKHLKSNVKTSHIPIVLITSNPSEKQHIEAIRAGVDDYIIKPFNADILLLRCNRLVRFYKKRSDQSGEQHETSAVTEITTNTQDQAFLQQATQVIIDNFENMNFDISVWGKHMGIGRTRLFNKIKNITGMTPNDYILSVKMNHAMNLLHLKNQITIAEVAYSLGFSNPAYFTRCFKKHTGVTPQQFRQKST